MDIFVLAMWAFDYKKLQPYFALAYQQYTDAYWWDYENNLEENGAFDHEGYVAGMFAGHEGDTKV